MSDHSLGAVVTDFSPLREPLQWLEDVKKKLPKDIPFIQVQHYIFSVTAVFLHKLCVNLFKEMCSQTSPACFGTVFTPLFSMWQYSQ